MPTAVGPVESFRQRKLESTNNTNTSPRNTMWRSLVINSQTEFRAKGWNLAGANLLALAVGLANRHYLYVRPRLTLRDFGYALTPAIPCMLVALLITYCAFGTGVLAEMAVLGCVLGLLVGGGSILWKVSHWQPVEKFLLGTSTGPPMDRSMQFELVDKLTLICTESGIDPDKLDELLDTFDFDEKGGAIFVNAVLDFFSTHMKMQE